MKWIEPNRQDMLCEKCGKHPMYCRCPLPECPPLPKFPPRRPIKVIVEIKDLTDNE